MKARVLDSEVSYKRWLACEARYHKKGYGRMKK